MRKIIENKVKELTRLVEEYEGTDQKTVKSSLVQLSQIMRKLNIKIGGYEKLKIGKKYFEIIKQARELLNIDVTEMLIKRVTSIRQIQTGLILKEYEAYSKQNMQYKIIKQRLTEKYKWSYSAIEKLVYGK